MAKTKKLWGGRFSDSTDPLAAAFNNSILFDWRLAEVDVRGSIAWAHALSDANVITPEEAEHIITGLEQIHSEIQAGSFQPDPGDEDVHTAIERRLGELIGPLAGKLHTGRSRNDQVATDLCLWLMEAVQRVDMHLKAAQSALVERAEQARGMILPGYTHMQRAQPVLLSHWWLSHFWPLQRDRERLEDMCARVAVLPLGAGALAGTPFLVDRQKLAQELGFAAVAPNSLDAVSNRDHAAEFLFIAALIAVHLSRLAEMLILFTTSEFGFIELSDRYATGSSLMPQKKNPDMLELTRGKAGTLIGRLAGLLAVLKGLPSAYDKDLQEDKQPLFEAADTLELTLPVMAGLLITLQVYPERMRAALDPGLLATDLADYLVRRGVPFRQAHHLVGGAVRRAQDLGLPLDHLPLDELQAIDSVFEEDVVEVFSFEASVSRRNVAGGTGPEAVEVQIRKAKECLS